jgi:hypothetical protein
METKKFLKQLLIVTALMVGAITLLSVVPMTAFAALGDEANPFKDLPPDGNIKPLVVKIVNYALTFLGIVAVMMIIYAGIRYVTSAGKQESIDTAKKIILYSLIGIVIILLSYAIVNTVIGAAAGGEAAI